MPQIYEKGLFSIDGLDGPYEGYSSGEHWNGWACPVFERDEAKRIAASFRTQSERHGLPGEFEARFDEDADAFLFRDPEDDPDEDPLLFGSDVVQVDDRLVTVYFIGTAYWTWEAGS